MEAAKNNSYAIVQLEAIIAHAQTSPDDVIIVDEEGARRTTYAHFLDLANFYAFRLKKDHRLTAGDVIALHLGRCMEHFALRIACAFAGLVFVSINPDYPPERAQQTIEKAHAKLVIDEAFLEALTKEYAASSRETIPCQLDTTLPDSAPYYLISTSGTTGKPKLIQHDRSVFELMRTVTHDFGFDTYTVRYAAMADMMFVMSMIEMLFFSSGDTLHIISNGMRTNIKELHEYFDREAISATSTLPALLAAIIPLPSLKAAYVAGEASNIDLNAFGIEVRNFYGASEAPGMAYGAANGSGALEDSFTNTHIWLEDEDGTPLSQDTPDVTGEVCFSGPGIMCAYVDDPEGTAKHVSQDAASRYRTYHTGDAAHYDNAGAIVLTGRLDSVVKIRGQRVDVAGVERTLSGVAGIAACAVVTRTAPTGDLVLAAFYTARPSQTQAVPTEETLRATLAESLPSYAIPTYFVPVETFKRTTSGKIERSVLQLPDTACYRASFVAPENSVQQSIVEAFGAVLGLTGIGIDDDFIRMGGDSLKAMRASAALASKNLTVATAEILRLRTARALAQLEGITEEKDTLLFLADDALPLTEPQLNVYLDMQAQGKSDAYLITESMDIPAGYTFEQVQDALRDLCTAHPVLCRKVAEIDGVPHLVPGALPCPELLDGENASLSKSHSLDVTRTLAWFALENAGNHLRLHATVHHLVFDGTSWIVFQRDLLQVLRGATLPLDEAYLRAASQAKTLQQHPKFQEAKAFFADLLAQADEAEPLLPDVTTSLPGRRTRALTLDMPHINAWCAQAGVTASALFTAAYAYTLSRFTGNARVLFNFLDNGRDEARAHDALGMFVVTCPFMVDCNTTDTHAFVQACASNLYQATTYSFYPYRLLAAEHNVNAAMLFQYRPDLWLNDDAQSNWEADEDFSADATQDSDFSFHVTQAGKTLQAAIVYSTHHSPETVQRFLYAFESILTGIVENQPLDALTFTAPEDIAFQDAINKTEAAVAHRDVLDVFTQSVARYPHNTLVTYRDSRWTYAQGAHIATELKTALECTGIQPRSHVAILVPRSQWYLLGALGVLATGAAYVPLNEEYPDERIAFMLQDTQAAAVVVTNDTASRARALLSSIGSTAALVNVDELPESSPVDSAAGEAFVTEAFAAHTPAPDDIACILYTSGTTGTPKGSLIPHAGLVNWLEWFVRASDMHDDDVYSLYASYSFDVHMGMFAPLITGGATAVVPEEVRLDPDALLRWVESAGVTTIHLPIAFTRLIKDRQLPSCVRTLRTGGDVIGDLHLADKHVRLLCLYGPTEFSVNATWIPAAQKCDPSSIGFPLPNVKLYVLDQQGRRVPKGAVGELHLSGVGIAQGYLNRPQETAAAFKANLFDGEIPGYQFMYATGDLVRQLPDGSIGFLGRRDTMVKIRGNRVECGEVEACIRTHPAIKDVAVVPLKTDFGTELVAYVVVAKDSNLANSGNQALCDELAAHIETTKPAFFVPSYVVALDVIPLNANGKVDKRKLPKPDLSTRETTFAAPQSEAERLVAHAFEDVLKIERIGLRDDFLHLGGDSIKAIRVVSLLRQNGATCQAKDILQLRTPARIAAILEMANANVHYDHQQGPIGLLPIQTRYFDNPQRAISVQTHCVRATEKLDAALFKQALRVACDAHDMLRATYLRAADGSVSQVIQPQGACSLTLEVLGEVSKMEELWASLQAHTKQLDPFAGRLGSVVLGSTPTGDYVAFALHHLVMDGYSWSILLDDLAEAYQCLAAKRTPNLACPYPYGAWASQVQAYAHALDEQEKSYWRKAHALLEPDDSTVQPNYEQFSFTLSRTYDAANVYDLSEQEYLLCAAARAYKKVYGLDAVFALESFGRDTSLADCARTIGWFTSRYPLHLPQEALGAENSVLRDVIACKRTLAGVPHEGIGYGAMVYVTRELHSAHAPVTFNYLADEFSHSNALFESENEANHALDAHFSSETFALTPAPNCHASHGLTLNILRVSQRYVMTGTVTTNATVYRNLSAFFQELQVQMDLITATLREVQESGRVLYPLTGNQLGFYLDDLSHAKAKAYLATRAVVFPPALNVDDACRIARALMAQHPVLSSRVESGANETLCMCDALEECEVVTVASDADEQRLQEYLNAPFDPAQSLARLVVISRDDGTSKPAETSLVFCLHHMISDYYTLDLLEREAKDLAAKLCTSREVVLDRDARDWGFLHTALEDDAYRANVAYAQDKEFFADYLADAPSIDSAPPHTDNDTAGRVCIRIPELTQKQRRFADTLGVTDHGLFLSAFAYTLALFSASEKVCFSFTEHGRHTDEELRAAGMYVRSFPVVVDCADRATSDFVTHAYASSTTAMQHSAYPFYQLVRDFDVNNEVTFESNTIFDSLVPAPEEDVVWEALPDDVSGIANFECILLRNAQGYTFVVTHTADYSKECALAFARTYRAVLAHLAASEALHDVALDEELAQATRETLMGINSCAPLVQHPDIIDVFARQVVATPHAVCLSDTAHALSYAEADALSDAIAATLTQHGITQQGHVVLLTGRNLFFSASMLACLKADITYIPVDEDQPAPRIARMMRIAGCSCLVATSATRSLAEAVIDALGHASAESPEGVENSGAATILCLDDTFLQQALEHPSPAVRVEPTPQSYNCILFTSGTTGDPKGIVNRRVTQSNLAFAIARVGIMTATDVYGLYASFGYSPHLDSLAALAAGASIHVVPQDVRLDMHALSAYCDEHALTHTFLSSSIAYRLFSQERPATLKVVFRGGEPVKDFASPTTCRIFDEFGCTECSNIFQIEAPKKLCRNELGYPIDNTHVYLLDIYGRPASLEAAGRLYVSGAQLASHALESDLPSNNANAVPHHKNTFMANTQENAAPFERMYPTGDIACLHQAHILHLGRTDGVIKIRGNRVELGEVEACIRAHESVADATVRVTMAQGNPSLVAYVVLTDEAKAVFANNHTPLEALRAHVSAAKPAFMVPAYFVALDAIPLNVHGKVNARALPTPDTTQLRAPYVAPRNDVENEIITAFQETLGETQLGIDDNFINLGGDSLKAIRAAALLERYSITGADILRLQTARACADVIQTNLDAQASSTASAKTDKDDVMQHALDLFNEYLGV